MVTTQACLNCGSSQERMRFWYACPCAGRACTLLQLHSFPIQYTASTSRRHNDSLIYTYFTADSRWLLLVCFRCLTYTQALYRSYTVSRPNRALRTSLAMRSRAPVRCCRSMSVVVDATRSLRTTGQCTCTRAPRRTRVRARRRPVLMTRPLGPIIVAIRYAYSVCSEGMFCRL
jgi:hypothetical protein